MTEIKDQRQQCQALLAQLKESQTLLKSQFLNNSQPHGLATLTNTAKSRTGILKMSSSVPHSSSRDKVLNFNLNNVNNCASLENSGSYSTCKNSSKVLPQGVPNSAGEFKSFGNYLQTTSLGTSYIKSDATDRDGKPYALNGTLGAHTAETLSTHGSFPDVNNPSLRSPELSSTNDQLTSYHPVSPSTKTWRQILNKHVTVPSQLSAEELRDLDKVQDLNFSYSYPDDTNLENSTVNPKPKPPYQRHTEKAGKTTVCKDITNKPVSVSINDMVTSSRSQPDNDKMQESRKVSDLDGEPDRRKVKFFKEQLEDDGNNRKLNSFIKDTTLKPKSLLNSTAFRNLSYSKQNSSNLEKTVEDQRLLGYDWIAALLDNESELVNQSESFFNELKDFRRAYKSECSNQFYKEGPHNLVEFEPEPVAEALAETKVHPYIVNERLFTQPFKSGLLDYDDAEDRVGDKGREKKAPTEDNPRFVRVSIPRSTLSTPYKVKPHRRRSFDGSDSCSLMDHCLLGWENTRPAMIPTAKSLDLNTEAGTRIDSQVTTLSEAEHLAAKFSQAEWPFSKPTARTTILPKWRKHYMDTTLNLTRLSDLSSVSNTSHSSGRAPAVPQDVKRSTDRILRATYSTMYEMERLRKERELELAAMREKGN